VMPRERSLGVLAIVTLEWNTPTQRSTTPTAPTGFSLTFCVDASIAWTRPTSDPEHIAGQSPLRALLTRC